jgi:conjugative relaxase-like TrwC/TraI family protein
MFRLRKIKRKGVDTLNYLVEQVSNQDYLSGKSKIIGKWLGILAIYFKLKGQEIKEGSREFERIFNGINPVSNTKITERTCSVACYDGVFSVPKSVSIQAVLGKDERIIDRIWKSAECAMKEVENLAACRIRDGEYYNTNENRSTGNLLYAAFLHRSSREKDPMVHLHCELFNFTYDPVTKKFKALQNEDIYRNIEFISRTFLNKLAVEMESLGYKTVITRDDDGNVKSFEIEGISHETIDKFSKRSSAVKDETKKFIKEHSRKPTPAELDVIKTETRKRKLYNISDEELFEYQFSQLNDEEKIVISNLKKAAKESNTVNHKDYEKVINSSLNSLTERISVLKINDLLKDILKENCGKIEIEELRIQIKNHPEIVLLDDIAVTTKEVLREEKEVIRIVADSMNSCPLANIHYVAFSTEEDIWNEQNNGFDYKKQRKTVRSVLSNRDKYQIFRGIAGAGKTTTLGEINKGYLEAGIKAYYFAPTKTAVKELKSISSEADTVSRLIVDFKNSKTGHLDNSVIVIDEAGLLSAKQGRMLSEIAKAHNSRVLFVGDSKQHSSVERGDFLRLLEEHSKIQTSELKEIRRQKDPELKKAVYLFSEGKAFEGLRKLDSLDVVSEKSNYMAEAANEFIKATSNGKKLEKTLAVAPTNSEVEKLNREIRYRLKKSEVLSSKETKIPVFKSKNWTVEQKKNISRYKIGDTVSFVQKAGSLSKNSLHVISSIQDKILYFNDGRYINIDKMAEKIDIGKLNTAPFSSGEKIRITANDHKLGLINGDVKIVQKIYAGMIITEDGCEIPIDFGHFQYGYTDTSHKSQGKTVDNVIIAAKRLDPKAAYVAPSRARYSVKIFTQNKETLFKSVSNSKNREAVMDYLRTSKKETEKEIAEINSLTENIKFTSQKKRKLKGHLIRQLRKFINKFTSGNKSAEKKRSLTKKKDQTQRRNNLYKKVQKQKINIRKGNNYGQRIR